jgi:hypothetical protein
MTNIGNLPAKGIDVQVLSPGFKVLSEKKWPDTIYPNSSITGQYILQPLYTGTHTIYVSTTYFTNNTSTRPFELKQMVSNSKLGEAKVQSDLFSSLSGATWLQHPLTLIIIGGIVTGIVGPRITNQHENHQKKLQFAVEVIIKISKGHAQLDNSLRNLIIKINEAVQKFGNETNIGMQKQKEELETEYKQ